MKPKIIRSFYSERWLVIYKDDWTGFQYQACANWQAALDFLKYMYASGHVER